MIAPWTAPVSAAQAALAQAMSALVPRIRTPRCQLSAPVLADFAVWSAIFCTDRARHMDGPYSTEEAWDQFCLYTASWPLRGHGAWTVDAGDGACGFVLIGFEPGDRDHELGGFFTEAAEGRGIATEAARAVIDHAFGPMGLTSLVSYTAPDNLRAARVCERLGARRDPDLLDGAQVWHHARTPS